MGSWLARTLALGAGAVAGCLVGGAIDRARRTGEPIAPRAPQPLAIMTATSMAGTLRGVAGLERRSPLVQLGIGFATGLILTTFGDALAAAIEG